MLRFAIGTQKCDGDRETGVAKGSRPNAFKGVIEVTEFQMHLRWLAEQRRLADLERQWREAEKREAYWALMAMLEDGTDDLIDDGQNDLNAEGGDL